ncbi:hypothetical protein E6O75_ATG01833 [Venturia nashicola]|uniref:Zn(2)-C6 fungal-type domain-containing protein n=1 Tax=Venturia nashicola TaxID=86259 RepID=A0A4Z1P783_9PEZI|nr:hypothetical protein E6O75_ATG01833 [Venturia nashicola]
MDEGQLHAHIAGIKRDINGLLLHLERIRRGELERDILIQINHKHETIQVLRRGQKERDILRQMNHKHEMIQAQRTSIENTLPSSSENSSDQTPSFTSPQLPGLSTASTSFDSSEGSDRDAAQMIASSTSLPNFSTFLKSTSSPTPPKTDIPVDPGTCPLCGRPCSQGNIWRHRKTCLGRCLNCTKSQTVCDDRGRGAPSHDCKACQARDVSCVYLDQSDGAWKSKAEFAHVTRFARLARVARSREEMRKEEEEEDRKW